MKTREIINPPLVADLIRYQARERPDEAALLFEGEAFTYGEMNARAKRCKP